VAQNNEDIPGNGTVQVSKTSKRLSCILNTHFVDPAALLKARILYTLYWRNSPLRRSLSWNSSKQVSVNCLLSIETTKGSLKFSISREWNRVLWNPIFQAHRWTNQNKYEWANSLFEIVDALFSRAMLSIPSDSNYRRGVAPWRESYKLTWGEGISLIM
jgi:hypothetical protein